MFQTLEGCIVGNPRKRYSLPALYKPPLILEAHRLSIDCPDYSLDGERMVVCPACHSSHYGMCNSVHHVITDDVIVTVITEGNITSQD